MIGLVVAEVDERDPILLGLSPHQKVQQSTHLDPMLALDTPPVKLGNEDKTERQDAKSMQKKKGMWRYGGDGEIEFESLNCLSPFRFL